MQRPPGILSLTVVLAGLTIVPGLGQPLEPFTIGKNARRHYGDDYSATTPCIAAMGQLGLHARGTCSLIKQSCTLMARELSTILHYDGQRTLDDFTLASGCTSVIHRCPPKWYSDHGTVGPANTSHWIRMCENLLGYLLGYCLIGSTLHAAQKQVGAFASAWHR